MRNKIKEFYYLTYNNNINNEEHQISFPKLTIDFIINKIEKTEKLDNLYIYYILNENKLYKLKNKYNINFFSLIDILFIEIPKKNEEFYNINSIDIEYIYNTFIKTNLNIKKIKLEIDIFNKNLLFFSIDEIISKFLNKKKEDININNFFYEFVREKTLLSFLNNLYKNSLLINNKFLLDIYLDNVNKKELFKIHYKDEINFLILEEFTGILNVYWFIYFIYFFKIELKINKNLLTYFEKKLNINKNDNKFYYKIYQYLINKLFLFLLNQKKRKKKIQSNLDLFLINGINFYKKIRNKNFLYYLFELNNRNNFLFYNLNSLNDYFKLILRKKEKIKYDKEVRIRKSINLKETYYFFHLNKYNNEFEYINYLILNLIED